jgi:hypothetical protein
MEDACDVLTHCFGEEYSWLCRTCRTEEGNRSLQMCEGSAPTTSASSKHFGLALQIGIDDLVVMLKQIGREAGSAWMWREFAYSPIP